jgi:hypothetical protein
MNPDRIYFPAQLRLEGEGAHPDALGGAIMTEALVALLVGALTASLGGLFPLVKGAIEGLLRSSPKALTAAESSVGKAILRTFDISQPSGPSGTKELLAQLAKTSTEMDRIVGEIGRFTQERQSTVVKLETDLETLVQREQELKTRIEGLEKVPLVAAEYFAKLVEKTEKKSAARDYKLFLFGVVASVVVAIILRAVFKI